MSRLAAEAAEAAEAEEFIITVGGGEGGGGGVEINLHHKISFIGGGEGGGIWRNGDCYPILLHIGILCIRLLALLFFYYYIL